MASKAFGQQSLALAEGGVDILWLETFSDIKELKAAIEGATQTGLPIVATMSFDTVGKTMMGVSPHEFGRRFMSHQAPPKLAWDYSHLKGF